MMGWNFSGYFMALANLSYGTLTGATLATAGLTNANLYCATLTGADLSNANLSYGTLTGANLTALTSPGQTSVPRRSTSSQLYTTANYQAKTYPASAWSTTT